MSYTYSVQTTDTSAKAVGLSLPISRKHSIMVCQAIRGMNVPDAKIYLENVTELKQHVPFTRFKRHLAHRKEDGPGRFPRKTCEHILAILKNAEANAQFKGLSTGNLIVKHVNAQKGPTVSHNGRHGRQAKRTHIEIIVEEIKQEASKKKTKKAEATK